MRLFIDTNVFLEFLFRRENFEEVVSFFKKIIWKSSFFLVTSDKAILDIYYVWLKLTKSNDNNISKKKLIDFLFLIKQNFEIYGWNNIVIENILVDNDFSDLEDKFQEEIAYFSSCDFIITLNKKDFKNSRILTLTPKERLARQSD